MSAGGAVFEIVSAEPTSDRTHHGSCDASCPVADLAACDSAQHSARAGAEPRLCAIDIHWPHGLDHAVLNARHGVEVIAAVT
jgi:hypothetical protein